MMFSNAHNDFLNLKYGNNDYLMHWGIKGQKWGIRRYQNPDGTLTPEGRRRYLNENWKPSDGLSPFTHKAYKELNSNQKDQIRKQLVKEYNDKRQLDAKIFENQPGNKAKLNNLYKELNKIAKYNKEEYSYDEDDEYHGKAFITMNDWYDLIDDHFNNPTGKDWEAIDTLMVDYINKHNIKFADW